MESVSYGFLSGGGGLPNLSASIDAASHATAGLSLPSAWDRPSRITCDLDIGSMMPVLLGMLGLGAMRTYEKKSGTNKNR